MAQGITLYPHRPRTMILLAMVSPLPFADPANLRAPSARLIRPPSRAEAEKKSREQARMGSDYATSYPIRISTMIGADVKQVFGNDRPSIDP